MFDNSFQFDATRDLLRELDVNDIVWIGLMRPQSSDRFMWSSNSRPLVADTGYWAESLPLMDAPLCAVIDPIRDYRWHALRCGGPETASFLCEMPVPSWADICILKDMPNLTMQYMADTASIELIRNCQEEGLLRTTCRGKQDRDRAMQDLICPRERLEAQRINDITNSHFKSLQIINSIPSDNNENNDIELLPMDVNYAGHYPEELQTEKNTVQRLIEQFNVDELMQADEPANMETVSSFYKIPGLIPKPVKKSAKKVLENPKKDNAGKKQTASQNQKDKGRIPLEMDDMMMGDQPQGEPEMPEQILNEEVSNEIMEPLPHIKKTNLHKEAMEKMEKEAIAMKEFMQKNKQKEAKKMMMMMATTMGSLAMRTTEEPKRSSSTTEAISGTTPLHLNNGETTTQQHHHHNHEDSVIDMESSTSHTLGGATTTPAATIGHPMHPQQPRSSVITEETGHGHVKESSDNSHFIPPMLMVKSHYVPQANKHGHGDHIQHPLSHGEHLESSTVSSSSGGGSSTLNPNEDIQHRTKEHSEVTMMMTTMSTGKVIDLESTTQAQTLVQHHLNEKIATESVAPLITEDETTENGNMIPITTQQQQQHRQEPEVDENLNSQIMNAEEEATKTPETSEATGLPSSTTIISTSTATTTPIAMEEDKTITTLTPSSLVQGSRQAELESLQTTTMKLAELTPNVATKGGDDTIALNLEEAQEMVNADATKSLHMQAKLKSSKNMESQAASTTAKQEENTSPPLTTATLMGGETLKTEQSTTVADVTSAGNENTADQQHRLVTETTAASARTTAPPASVEQIGQELTRTQPSELDKDQLYFETKSDEEKETTPKSESIMTTVTSTATTEQAIEIATGRVKLLATDIQQTTETSGEMSFPSEQQHKTIAIEASETTSARSLTPTSSIASPIQEQKQTGDDDDVNTEEISPNAMTEKTVTAHSSLEMVTSSSSTITTLRPAMTSEANENITNNSATTEGSTTNKIISSTTTTTTIASSNNNGIISTSSTEDSLPLTHLPSTSSSSSLSTTSTTTTTTTTTPSSPPPAAAPSSTMSFEPETTRNFLKVTTEMPFKPNRRRSLTKPETVSYMKKILG
ncbi:uncharacterized protein LOC142231394 [Haematobia irritans]|uniref:uncharacterized protein LOC142231394 n=1 Tax=Haematobia irritans TaxID=7368 RepID=UPI003F4FC469